MAIFSFHRSVKGLCSQFTFTSRFHGPPRARMRFA